MEPTEKELTQEESLRIIHEMIAAAKNAQQGDIDNYPVFVNK